MINKKKIVGSKLSPKGCEKRAYRWIFLTFGDFKEFKNNPKVKKYYREMLLENEGFVTDTDPVKVAIASDNEDTGLEAFKEALKNDEICFASLASGRISYYQNAGLFDPFDAERARGKEIQVNKDTKKIYFKVPRGREGDVQLLIEKEEKKLKDQGFTVTRSNEMVKDEKGVPQAAVVLKASKSMQQSYTDGTDDQKKKFVLRCGNCKDTSDTIGNFKKAAQAAMAKWKSGPLYNNLEKMLEEIASKSYADDDILKFRWADGDGRQQGKFKNYAESFLAGCGCGYSMKVQKRVELVDTMLDGDTPPDEPVKDPVKLEGYLQLRYKNRDKLQRILSNSPTFRPNDNLPSSVVSKDGEIYDLNDLAMIELIFTRPSGSVITYSMTGKAGGTAFPLSYSDVVDIMWAIPPGKESNIAGAKQVAKFQRTEGNRVPVQHFALQAVKTKKMTKSDAFKLFGATQSTLPNSNNP